MDKKPKKILTEYEKKYIEEEIKKTKEINDYLATTKIKVATFKRPKIKGDKEEGNK